MELSIFICVGILTGLSAGLLGIGGGIISVPAMIFILPYFDVPPDLIMHIAIATSLALIVPTSIISAYSHSRKNAIEWSWVLQLSPGLILGACLGAYLVILSDQILLQNMFAVFLLLIAVHMLINKSSEKHSPISINSFFPASIIGMISSLMGVGGGTMTVPYLNWQGLSLPKAIGTSAFCGLPIAIAGSVMFYVLNRNESETVNLIYLPAFIGILIGVVVFAPIGAKLTHQINVILLRRIFIFMILMVAVKLLME